MRSAEQVEAGVERRRLEVRAMLGIDDDLSFDCPCSGLFHVDCVTNQWEFRGTTYRTIKLTCIRCRARMWLKWPGAEA